MRFETYKIILANAKLSGVLKLKTKQAQNILRDYAKPESNELVDDTQQQKLRLHSHIWRPRFDTSRVRATPPRQ